MKHFNNITYERKKELFLIQPKEFNNNTDISLLKYSLGSLLYMPGDRKDISNIILERKYPEMTSMAWCLEDALNDEHLKEGEENVLKQLRNIQKNLDDKKISINDIPLIFIRVRDHEQLTRLLENIKQIINDSTSGVNLLTGFIFPKFDSRYCLSYLNTLYSFNKLLKTNYYCMPIIESSKVMYLENRKKELMTIFDILNDPTYKDMILNIRIGATDFSSLYGLRRSIDNTIYDICVIRDVITDLINVFNRNNTFIISGPVWEYFNSGKTTSYNQRILKPLIRETPFKEHYKNRQIILDNAIDGLIKEVILDKVNGLIGKTTIHPSHIKYINSLQVVLEEEYLDAKSIVESNGSGVSKGVNGNKMNENKPHLNWAKEIIAKSEIYGVLRGDKNYVDLF